MAGQNLLDERGPRTRQPDDKNRTRCGASPMRTCPIEGFCEHAFRRAEAVRPSVGLVTRVLADRRVCFRVMRKRRLVLLFVFEAFSQREMNACAVLTCQFGPFK